MSNYFSESQDQSDSSNFTIDQFSAPHSSINGQASYGDDGLKVTARLTVQDAGRHHQASLSQMANGRSRNATSVSRTLYNDGSVTDGIDGQIDHGYSQVIGTISIGAPIAGGHQDDFEDAPETIFEDAPQDVIDEVHQDVFDDVPQHAPWVDVAGFGGQHRRPQIPNNPPRAQEFEVFVKNFNGKSYTFKVTEDLKVQELMKRIHISIGVPVEQQVLNFGGKLLQKGNALGQYDVTPNSTIFLTGRLRGG